MLQQLDLFGGDPIKLTGKPAESKKKSYKIAPPAQVVEEPSIEVPSPTAEAAVDGWHPRRSLARSEQWGWAVVSRSRPAAGSSGVAHPSNSACAGRTDSGDDPAGIN